MQSQPLRRHGIVLGALLCAYASTITLPAAAQEAPKPAAEMQAVLDKATLPTLEGPMMHVKELVAAE